VRHPFTGLSRTCASDLPRLQQGLAATQPRMTQRLRPYGATNERSRDRRKTDRCSGHPAAAGHFRTPPGRRGIRSCLGITTVNPPSGKSANCGCRHPQAFFELRPRLTDEPNKRTATSGLARVSVKLLQSPRRATEPVPLIPRASVPAGRGRALRLPRTLMRAHAHMQVLIVYSPIRSA
jgi:hypothetical protein